MEFGWFRRIKFQFGANGVLKSFSMGWRTVEPLDQYPVATKEQFLERIRKGKCYLHLDSPSEIQSLAITNISPCYLERPATEAEEEIHPIAVLECQARMPKATKKALLFCPLLVYPKEFNASHLTPNKTNHGASATNSSEKTK